MTEIAWVEQYVRKYGLSYGKGVAEIDAGLIPPPPEMEGIRRCAYCGKRISKSAHASRRYCSAYCRQHFNDAKKSAHPDCHPK